MMRTPLYIDLHALQTVPPSCVNRDDTGSPKTARFGGVLRARVSSQAWKKAMRDSFQSLLDEEDIGERTQYAADAIAERIQELTTEIGEDEALKLAVGVLGATGVKVGKDGKTGYLLFISPRQELALAQLAVNAWTSNEKVVAKQARAILNLKERPTLNAIDIALFGRMVTDAPDLNVDAAVQVAHAIGVGAAQTEYDYFTAMDDRSPEDNAGAGMIGTVEYLSATFYRYATVDVYHLYENLGSIVATRRAVEAFCHAFASSMPTGKQNTFANHTLPAVVLMQLRDTQPVSLVNAFELPVFSRGEKSQTEVACSRLLEQARAIDEAFATSPVRSYATVASSSCKTIEEIADECGPLAQAISSVGEFVETYLQDCIRSGGAKA